jgi:hypothetical protein
MVLQFIEFADKDVTIFALLSAMLCLVTMYFLFRLQSRNQIVGELLFEAIELCESYNNRRLQEVSEKKLPIEKYRDAFEWFFPKLPSLSQMMYSTKPLKLESFIDIKLIEQLKS